MRTVDRRRLLFLLLAVAVLSIALAAGYSGVFRSESPTGDDTSAVASPLDDPPRPVNADSHPPAQLQQPVSEPLGFPAALPNPANVVKLPVLMFHHIGALPPDADAIRQGLTVSTADFDSMMSYLKQAGYEPVSQKQLFKALYSGEPLPPHPVMITLDDGYSDNFTEAAPVLEKYGFTATFYIITGNVGSPEFMTWNQITELDRKGMDIGSHTESHPDLTGLSATSLAAELNGSESVLTTQLGHHVYWLCYPAGAFDPSVESAAKQAGYLLAVTTKAGEKQSSDAPYELWRYRVRSDTGLEEFKELVK